MRRNDQRRIAKAELTKATKSQDAFYDFITKQRAWHPSSPDFGYLTTLFHQARAQIGVVVPTGREDRGDESEPHSNFKHAGPRRQALAFFTWNYVSFVFCSASSKTVHEVVSGSGLPPEGLQRPAETVSDSQRRLEVLERSPGRVEWDTEMVFEGGADSSGDGR
jgi:hypothetical protein